MLIRISLIVAILASLAVAGIDFVVLKDKIEKTLADRDDQHKKYTDEQADKRRVQTKLDNTKKDLDRTTADLADARTKEQQAQAKQADAEKATALALDNLKKTQADLESTKDKLGAWLTLGIPVQQAKQIIDSVKATIAEKDAIEAEKAIIYAKCNKLQDQLDSLIGPHDPPMPEGLTGKVTAVDPRYDFVVLNIGSKQGARLDGKLLVQRGGKLVAKLWITDKIEDNTCIANILPGWKLSDIMEGDTVFY